MARWPCSTSRPSRRIWRREHPTVSRTSNEAGVENHYLKNPPFPMTEFTLKAKRIQYAAGNPAMVARLIQVLGRQT